MKKKTDLTNLLDELRHEDIKKRYQAVLYLKEIGIALGPVRTRM